MSDSTSTLKEQLRTLLPLAMGGIALGVTSAMIMLSRPVEPLDPPLPTVDIAAAAPIAAHDRDVHRKMMQGATPPAEIRAIGSAFLSWNEAASRASAENPEAASYEYQTVVGEIRSSMGVARRQLGAEATDAQLRDLRSYHTESFLAELDRFALSGAPSHELTRLGGGVLGVLQHNGWVGPTGEAHVPKAILRARYKLFWTSVVYSINDCDHEIPAVCYGLTLLPLDVAELRALLQFLVVHPVLRDEDLVNAPTLEVAEDRRRMVYLDRIAALDAYADPKGGSHPYLGNYDAQLARAAMLYRLGQYQLSLDLFNEYVADHRDNGRARNWRLAAMSKVHGD